MRDAMAAPFASGFIQRGFGINAEIDDFVLKTNQMRGITTGLRHEVGKLRNTLLLIAFATTGVVSAFKDWFQASLKAESSLVGLKAVAINTGLSFDKLKETSVDLENKGFLSIGGSAAALKNLAASNITMSQTISVMKALTDAAAFNRQGTLSMEEAIVGATQGIKNQNSIMVDNAGITKNISIMYREYALAIGKTSGALTEQEKKQAIVNGIIREAALFSGNAEKSLTTYQGKITQFQTKLLQTKRDLGTLIAPGVVEGLTTISEIFAEQGKQSLFQKAIEGISNSFSMLIKTVGFFAKELQNTFNLFNTVTFGRLGAAFESPIVKLGLMIVLLKKVGTYITGMADSLRAGAFATQFQQIEGSMLRAASLMKLNWVPPTFLQGALTQVQALKTGIMNIPTQMGNTLSKIGTKIHNAFSLDDRTFVKKELPYMNPHVDKLREQGVKETQAQAQVILAMKGKTAEELIQEQIGNRLNVIMARRVSLTRDQALENVRLNQLDESRLKIADALTEREMNRLSISRREKANKIIDQKLEIERGKLLDIRAVTRAPKSYQIDTKLMNEMQAEKLNIEKQIQGIKLQNATLDKNTEFNAKTIGAMKLKNEEQINMLKAKSLQIEEAIVTQRNLQKGLPPPLPPGASPERKALRKAITAPGITPAAIEAKELAIIQEINNLEAKRALHNSGIVVLKTQNLSLESNEVLIAESLKNNQLSYLSRLKLRNELEIESLALNTRLSEVQHKIKTGGMKPELLQEQDRLTNQIEINRRRLLNVENGIDFNIEHQNFLLEEQKILLSGNLTFDKEKLLTSKEILMSKQNELETELLMNNARLTGFNIMRQLKDKVGEGGKVERKAGTIFMTKDLPGQQKAIESGDVEIVKRNGKLMTAYLNEAARANMSMTGRMVYDWKMFGTSIRNAGIQARLFFLSFKTGVTQSVASTGTFIGVLTALKTAFITTGAALMSLFSKIMIWYTIIQVIYDLVKDLFKDNTQAILDQIHSAEIEIKAISDLSLKHKQLKSSILGTRDAYAKLDGTGLAYIDLISEQGRAIYELVGNMDTLTEELFKQQNAIAKYKEGLLHGTRELDDEWYQKTVKNIDDLKTKYNVYYNELTALQDKFNSTIESSIESLNTFSTKGGGTFSSIISKSQDYLKQIREFTSNRLTLSAIPVSTELSKAFGSQNEQINLYKALNLAAEDDYYRELRKIVDSKEKEILAIRQKYLDLQLENVNDSLEKQLLSIKRNIEKEKMTIDEEMRKLISERTMIDMQNNMQQLILEMFKTMSSKETKEAIDNFGSYFTKTVGAYFELEDFIYKIKVNGGDDKVLIRPVEEFGKEAVRITNEVNTKFKEIGLKLSEAKSLLWDTLTFGELKLNVGDADKLTGIIADLRALDTELTNIQIKGFEKGEFFDFTPQEKKLKQFVENYKTEFQELTRAITTLFSETDSMGTYDRMDEKLKTSVKITTAEINKQLAVLEKYKGENTKVMSEKMEKMVSDFEDMFKYTNKEAFALKELDLIYQDITPDMYDFIVSQDGLNSSLAENKHIDELVKISLGKLGIEIKEFTKRIDAARAAIELYQKKAFYTSMIEAFNKILRESTYELELQRDALMSVKDTEFLDFYKSSSKIILGLTDDLDKFKEASNFNTVDFSLPFTKALSSFKVFIQQFGEEENKLSEDIQNKYEKINIIESILGLDNENINRINAKYNTLSEIGNKFFNEYNQKLRTQITQMENSGLYSDSNGLDEIQKLKDKLIESERAAKLFGDTILGLKINTTLQEWKQAAFELAGGLVNMFAGLGSVINEVQNNNDQIRSEQSKTIQDIDKLYQTGEISQGERLYRMAEMNKYYSNQIQSTWDAVSKNVIQSALQMTQSIIQAMAQAAAAKYATEGISGLIGGLGAALPFAGLALGVGYLASQLSNTSEAPAAPEFNTPENVASKFGGTIKAEEVTITIQPTFFIEGQQIFIGSGSVVEFVDEATDLMKAGIQQAIDNKEFTFDSIRSISK
jgi:hypothetical protein